LPRTGIFSGSSQFVTQAVKIHTHQTAKVISAASAAPSGV